MSTQLALKTKMRLHVSAMEGGTVNVTHLVSLRPQTVFPKGSGKSGW